jgi:cation transport ATPase-like protein
MMRASVQPWCVRSVCGIVEHACSSFRVGSPLVVMCTSHLLPLSPCCTLRGIHTLSPIRPSITPTRHAQAQDTNDGVHMSFLRTLALCHTVVPDPTPAGIDYKASSPDEAALVEAAARLGVELLRREGGTVTIRVRGVEETWEVLHTLEFSSERKRMSTVMRGPDGIVKVFMKGAWLVALCLMPAPILTFLDRCVVLQCHLLLPLVGVDNAQGGPIIHSESCFAVLLNRGNLLEYSRVLGSRGRQHDPSTAPYGTG